ncbi:MAG: dephospho-CoA kinase [Lachnospiraceae bacterium]|nr:dephospho-CoA kinase [Lachnospiraceae bacterium]MBP3610931.1 dephospho-CoA kinase [Lachnospiraceae bacterium]
MHITLTGNLGSGKSTLSKILEAEYGYEIFSTGKVIRRIAEEHGLSVLEMNELMKKDPKYDHEIDDTTARISRENPDKSILFDSRLAWHFVEKSFKVFLSVSLDVAADRVKGDSSRGEVESYESLEDAKQKLKKRAEAEDVRYKELYGIEYFNYSNYNLVLDSTDCAPDILAKILKDEADAYEKAEKEGKGGYSRLILSMNRPEEDFAKEKAAGVVTKETLHGVEFTVVTLNQ